MQSASATFACHKCGKPYDWRPEFVGKTAKCPCGAVLRIPSAPPGSDAAKKEIAYKDPNPGCLLSPPGTHAQMVTAPPPPIPTAEESILAMMGPIPGVRNTPRAPMEVPDEDLDAHTEKELKELAAYGEEEEYKANPYLDFKLPMILLGVGFVLALAEAGMATRGGLSFIGAMIGIVFSVVVNVILIIVGLLVAAKIAGINFGPVPTAILKMAAIYLAPTTLGSLVTAVLGGDMAVGILGWAVSVILYWTLLSYLFRLDGSQTMICVFCIGMIRMLATMLIVGAALTALSGGGDHLVDDIDQMTETITNDE